MHGWEGWARCNELIQVIRKAISLNREWEQKAGRGDSSEIRVLVYDHLHVQGRHCPIAPEPLQAKILNLLCHNRAAQNYSHWYRNSQVNPVKSCRVNVATSTFSVALVRMLLESGNSNLFEIIQIVPLFGKNFHFCGSGYLFITSFAPYCFSLRFLFLRKILFT